MSSRATRTVGAGAAAALLSMTLVGCGSIPSSATGGGGAPAGEAASNAPAGSSTQPGSPSQPSGGARESTAPTTQPVAFTSNVQDGSGGVKVDTLVKVKAANGTLDKVTLKYRGVTRAGKSIKGTVAGALTANHAGWLATERLEPSATYTLTMSGKDASGQADTTKSSFRTARLSAHQETFASVAPQPGSSVGIGMPAILTFDVPVKNRAAIEKNLHVTSVPAQEGTWSWLSSQEVRYRPRTWWKPGTKVTVHADINGVRAGGGVYGQKSVSTHFTVGRSFITKVNLASHQARVYINGKLARKIPISAGRAGWQTRSGIKLIMDKRPMVHMTGVSIGIKKGSAQDFALNVRWAMRITASGEYLHAAPWNSGKFGRVNGSHGCVGMSTTNALWMYKRVKEGDPVITTGSSKKLYQGNGLADWNISYAKFKSHSAL